MYSLLKKELLTFFGSITGYLVISIFLLATGLILWVLPGDFNIMEGQRASLDGLFNLAPWVYLFLIPAITMRMFAEEKRTATIELLITRPISIFKIVFAKYLASLSLVLVSLLPSLVYLFSVYRLGNPVGNIDMGAVWGSYLGLFFLASIYISIGLWASSLASNQVVSFLIAIIVSFCFYVGFDYAASVGLPFRLQSLLLKFGINEHYSSISRGVIDSRDIVYYVAVTALFLLLSKRCVSTRKMKFSVKSLVITFVSLVCVCFFVSYRIFRIDMTSEKRYSLSETTKSLLNRQKGAIYVEIYLTGDLPAGMDDFRDAIIEKIEDLNAYSSYRFIYRKFDVYSIISEKERERTIEQLSNLGIQPVNFNHKTNEGLSVRQIFPGVLVQYGTRSIGLDLLKRNPLLDADENLNQSIELLEYQFARAIRFLTAESKPRVAFLAGQGEASEYETADIRYALSENYDVVTVDAEHLLADDTIETLIIADPQMPFSNQDKFSIDQFVMRGGKTLWCVDPVYCSIDSLSQGYSTIAWGKDLNITDLLFKYGVRLSTALLQDVVCVQYPVNTAPQGQQTQFVPAPFYYTPLAQPNQSHPLSRNLGHVIVEFPSMVEHVGESSSAQITPILTTSDYSRIINTPVEVSLLSATMPPDRQLFTSSNVPIGVLSEGVFESLFKNRMTSGMNVPQNDVLTESASTKMVVIADGNIIKNKVRVHGESVQLQSLGFDQYSGQLFGNREFLVNCVDYLTDGDGIMQLRTRVVKLRLLDKVLLRENKTLLRVINVVVPVAIILLFGVAFGIARKRKFGRKLHPDISESQA